ncbi:MAG: FG-GAP repeat domain-containing protein [Planctomycetota bacterium]|jgi:hypothetical protein
MLSRDRVIQYLIWGKLVIFTVVVSAFVGVCLAQSKKAPTMTKEIAIIGDTGRTPFMIYGHDDEGGYSRIYSHPIERRGGAFVEAWDYDGDGRDEFVVGGKNKTPGTGGMLFLYSFQNGKIEAKRLDDNAVWGITIGDTDGDGRDEAVTLTRGNLPGKVYPKGLCIGIYQKEGSDSEINYTELDPVAETLFKQGMGHLEICDIDGDGVDEIFSPLEPGGKYAVVMSMDGENGLKVEKFLGSDESTIRVVGENFYDSRATKFFDKVKQTTSGKVNKELGYNGDPEGILFSDMDLSSVSFGGGPDRRDILMTGYDFDMSKFVSIKKRSGLFQVIRMGQDGKFESFYTSKDMPAGSWAYSSAFGDADNDGKIDAVIGSDSVRVFRYDRETLTQVWESDKAAFVPGVSSVSVADTDGDGLNEIVAMMKKPRQGQQDFLKDETKGERIVVYGNKGKGTEIEMEWESESFPAYFRMAVGNFDGK